MMSKLFSEVKNLLTGLIVVSLALYVFMSLLAAGAGVWDGRAKRRTGDWRVFAYQCGNPPRYVRVFFPAYGWGCAVSATIPAHLLPRFSPL